MRLALMAAVTCAALGWSEGGAAQTFTDSMMVVASEPDGVARALQQLGYRAVVSRQSDGDPMIETAMSGYNVKLFFMNCKNNRACEDVQFFVGVATERKLSLAQVNAFNADKRFIRLYLDGDRDPLMELDLSMIGPGVSFAVFRDTLNVFEAQVGNLAKLIETAK